MCNCKQECASAAETSANVHVCEKAEVSVCSWLNYACRDARVLIQPLTWTKLRNYFPDRRHVNGRRGGLTHLSAAALWRAKRLLFFVSLSVINVIKRNCLGIALQKKKKKRICEAITACRRDNPPTDAPIVATPPLSLSLPSSTYSPACLGEEPQRLLSEMIMKTG